MAPEYGRATVTTVCIRKAGRHADGFFSAGRSGRLHMQCLIGILSVSYGSLIATMLHSLLLSFSVSIAYVYAANDAWFCYLVACRTIASLQHFVRLSTWS